MPKYTVIVRVVSYEGFTLEAESPEAAKKRYGNFLTSVLPNTPMPPNAKTYKVADVVGATGAWKRVEELHIQDII